MPFIKTEKSMSLMLILILVGLLAGILSGVIGIGGGIVIVPALVYFLHMSQHQAQGTSLALLLLPVGMFAVYNYYKAGHVDGKAVVLLAIGFVIGGYIGSKISLSLSPAVLKKVFGSILILIAIKLIAGK